MSFNKKKFNIIVCLTLALFCFAVVLSSVETVTVERQDPNHISAEGDLDEDLTEDLPNQETSTDQKEESSNGQTSSGNETTSSSQTQVEKAPTFKNGISALDYALSELEKQASYRISFSQTVVGTTLGFSGTQYLTRDIYHQDGNSFVRVVADGSNIPLGLGESYTEFYSIDSNNITKSRDGKITSQTIASYTADYGILPSEIPYALSNASNISFAKNAKKDYYTLTINLTESCWKGYLRYIGKTGGDNSNPKMTSIKLTINIDKTYGRITQISATEAYKINRGNFEADTDSRITMKFTYGKDYSEQISQIQSNFN